MKKYIFVASAILISVILFKQLQPVVPYLSIEEQLGKELVNKLGENCYHLSGWGWQGRESKNRASYLLEGFESFQPEKHISVFFYALKDLLNILNQNEWMLEGNGEPFNNSNTGFSIFWPDSNSRSDICPKAMVGTGWKDSIILVYFLPDSTEATKYIPYETFKKLVEEKRFDEILHYGE